MMARDQLLLNNMVLSGNLPSHLQERVMKEAVGMSDPTRSTYKGSSGGAGHIYNHKMLNNDNVLASSVGYTSNNSAAMTSQMKSKKASRHENTSVGPTSKFKPSAHKMSHLS